MTNLSDEMLCFPPTTACSFSISADLANPDGTGTGAGMGGGCGSGHSGSASRDFLSEFEQSWVKLPPNQIHVTQCLSGVEFARPGRWNVASRYHRGEVSSKEKSILLSLGCKLPETDVTSSPIAIVVLDEQTH